jgi:23S rRNA pseudouridine1911/1915/1917 synthase
MRAQFPIPPDLRGERADKVVATIAGVSRQLARTVFEKQVLVDSRAVEPDERVTGQSIEFEGPESAPMLTPAPVPFVVRYEDEHLLVVDKPAGVVVHPGAGRESATLAAGLLAAYPELRGVVGSTRKPPVFSSWAARRRSTGSSPKNWKDVESTVVTSPWSTAR